MKDVTEAELAILEVLWEEGAATIRILTDTLYPRGGTSSYATVQKLLERLENKGCVRRRRTPVAHEFSAVVTRQELVDRRLRDLTRNLCGGSVTPLITHLVQDGALSDEDVAALRRLVDQHRGKRRGRGEAR